MSMQQFTAVIERDDDWYVPTPSLRVHIPKLQVEGWALA